MGGKLQTGWKAIRQLGLRQTGQFALYQFLLRSGWIEKQTPLLETAPSANLRIHSEIFRIPSGLITKHLQEDARLMVEAQEILDGNVRLFGGPTVKLNLQPAGTSEHWTKSRIAAGKDIKLIWEPARFGWAFTLGRAYTLSGDERLARCFWLRWEEFQVSNPVNRGPNWESGQEVALRMAAWIFAAQAFASSPESNPERMTRLAAALADHARRIPPTLSYARAQNNNHYASEALGLYLAGTILNHPKAPLWRKQGWKCFLDAVDRQFLDDGTYAQHSTNYHRLVLQLSLLFLAAARQNGGKLPEKTHRKLASAVRWLFDRVDLRSGKAINLGSNDGALILPLAKGGFEDYRATLQAAFCAFCGGPCLPAGPWDELCDWLGLNHTYRGEVFAAPITSNSGRVGDDQQWCLLRAVEYKGRPNQSDQLHMDLFWKGQYILRDAGTYSYSLESPWENGLAGADVHNSLLLDGIDPMTRAGKFLWLDWAQAYYLPGLSSDGIKISAQQHGYQKLGVLQRRSVEILQTGKWLITDQFIPAGNHVPEHTYILHWLAADGKWKMDGNQIQIQYPFGQICLEVWASQQGSESAISPKIQVIRAGQVMAGRAEDLPRHGWYSPTYLVKEPAISMRFQFASGLPLSIITEIRLIEKSTVRES